MEFIDLSIDGHGYTLAYDFNEICKAETLAGVNLLEALQDLRSLTAGQLRGLFIAALETGELDAFPGKSPRQSLEAAGDLIRLDTIGPITLALAKAYGFAVQESDPEEPAGPVVPDPAVDPPK